MFEVKDIKASVFVSIVDRCSSLHGTRKNTVELTNPYYIRKSGGGICVIIRETADVVRLFHLLYRLQFSGNQCSKIETGLPDDYIVYCFFCHLSFSEG